MNTATTASHIQRQAAIPRQNGTASGSSVANRLTFPEIASRLPRPELRNLDVATLKRLLREAERIAANTNLALRTTIGQLGTLPTWPRVGPARRWNGYRKAAGST